MNHLNLWKRCTDAAKTLGFDVTKLENGAPVLRHNGPGATLSMISGIHGDERSGPLFLTELLATWAAHPEVFPRNQRMLIVPLLNDRGWNQHRREWWNYDLNRNFHGGTTIPMLNELHNIYRSAEIGVHWDLHEDEEDDEPYVFEYIADPHDFSHRLATRLGCRVELWSMWDHSSECCVRALGAPRVVTTEVPPTWPMYQRVAWLHRAWGAVLQEAEAQR